MKLVLRLLLVACLAGAFALASAGPAAAADDNPLVKFPQDWVESFCGRSLDNGEAVVECTLPDGTEIICLRTTSNSSYWRCQVVGAPSITRDVSTTIEPAGELTASQGPVARPTAVLSD